MDQERENILFWCKLKRVPLKLLKEGDIIKMMISEDQFFLY